MLGECPASNIDLARSVSRKKMLRLSPTISIWLRCWREWVKIEGLDEEQDAAAVMSKEV